MQVTKSRLDARYTNALIHYTQQADSNFSMGGDSVAKLREQIKHDFSVRSISMHNKIHIFIYN